MQGMGKYEKAPQSMHIKPINGDAAHRASVPSKEQPSSMPQEGPGNIVGSGKVRMCFLRCNLHIWPVLGSAQSKRVGLCTLLSRLWGMFAVEPCQLTIQITEQESRK